MIVVDVEANLMVAIDVDCDAGWNHWQRGLFEGIFLFDLLYIYIFPLSLPSFDIIQDVRLICLFLLLPIDNKLRLAFDRMRIMIRKRSMRFYAGVFRVVS